MILAIVVSLFSSDFGNWRVGGSGGSFSRLAHLGLVGKRLIGDILTKLEAPISSFPETNLPLFLMVQRGILELVGHYCPFYEHYRRTGENVNYE